MSLRLKLSIQRGALAISAAGRLALKDKHWYNKYKMTNLTKRILKADFPMTFTASDLKRLEPKRLKRSLQVGLAVGSGEIINIGRGCYAVGEKCRRELYCIEALSQKLNPCSYISAEYALSSYSWIPEAVYVTTCVTLGKTERIKTVLGCIEYFRIIQKDLFAGVAKCEYGNETYFQAKPLKALADMIGERGYSWTSLKPVVESLRIEIDDLEVITGADFDEIQGNYEASHVERFLEGIRKELQV
jgi:hypothetical protein